MAPPLDLPLNTDDGYETLIDWIGMFYLGSLLCECRGRAATKITVHPLHVPSSASCSAQHLEAYVCIEDYL